MALPLFMRDNMFGKNPPANAVMTTSGWMIMDSFADCQTTPAKSMPCAKACPKNKKEEIPMSSYSTATVITADSIEASQRRTLKNALYEAFSDKKSAARKQFNIDADQTPETIADLIQRIKDGKFTMKDDYAEYSPWSFMNYIEWKDPSVKADKDGYKAAKEQLTKEYEAIKLRLEILPLADALTAVETYRDGAAKA